MHKDEVLFFYLKTISYICLVIKKESMEEIRDINDRVLKNLDVIDLHQTVNGENLFIVADLEAKDIRYFHNPSLKYEYSVDDLFGADKYSGEVGFEIVDKEWIIWEKL
jgi:hypothetical protein